MMTYAEHQEAAAKALADLVVAGDTLRHRAEATDILLCRRHAILTLTERMQHLGCPIPSKAVPRRATADRLVAQPLLQLAAVAQRLPQPTLPDVAPSDVLPRRANEPTAVVKSWRTAARELFLATSEMQRADEKVWLSQPAAAWYAAGDVADCLNALVALDATLERVGALPSLPPNEIIASLLVTSDVARLARMWGDDHAADDATAGLGALLHAGEPRIRMVRSAEDLISAQRRLAAFVRPIHSDSDLGAAADRPGLRIARALAAGQARLALQFASWADAAPGAEGLAERFRSRVSLYRDLHSSTRRLVDVQPQRPTLPLIQQSEMVSQLPRVAGRSPGVSTLAKLDEASHDVAVNLGRSLRREGLHGQTIQVLVAEGVGLPAPRPIPNVRDPFHRACRALSDEPAAEVSASTRERTGERLRLRATLDAVKAPSAGLPRRAPATVLGSPARGRSA